MAITSMKELAGKSGPLIKQDSLSNFIRSKISQTLSGRKGEDFVTAVVSLVSHNPALAKCDRTSLCVAALQAQSLGLSLNQQLGQAWIIPYESRKKGLTEATFQIGYRGYIQLAIRSGQYKKLNVLPIKEGELKYFDPLNEELDVDLIQNEVERAKTPSIGYFAMFEYLNGFRKAIYWTREKMMEHAKTYSPAYAYDLRTNGKNSFWSKDFDAMACKTMLRQLITKWGIMSVDMEKAIESDSVSGNETLDDVVMDVSLKERQNETIEVESGASATEVRIESENSKQAADRQRVAKVASRVKAKETARADLQTMAATPEAAQVEAGDIQCPREGPDGNPRIVSEADCLKCGSRRGCPAWSEEW